MGPVNFRSIPCLVDTFTLNSNRHAQPCSKDASPALTERTTLTSAPEKRFHIDRIQIISTPQRWAPESNCRSSFVKITKFTSGATLRQSSAQTFPRSTETEYRNIVDVLSRFRLQKSWINTGGGRKSKISEWIDGECSSLDGSQKSLIQRLLSMSTALLHRLTKLTV
jgi:hypothetical protein